MIHAILLDHADLISVLADYFGVPESSIFPLEGFESYIFAIKEKETD